MRRVCVRAPPDPKGLLMLLQHTSERLLLIRRDCMHPGADDIRELERRACANTLIGATKDDRVV